MQLVASERTPGQRERALAVLRQAPPGSVGAAIRPLLEGAMSALNGAGFVAGSALTSMLPGGGILAPLVGMQTGAMAREFAAGAVGDFYEQQRELLYQPATDANIQEFARRETAFFATQSMLPRAVGSGLSAEQRAALIAFSRDLQR